MEFSEALEQVPPFPPGGGERVNREREEKKRGIESWQREHSGGSSGRGEILDEAVGEATLRGEDWERTDWSDGRGFGRK